MATLKIKVGSLEIHITYFARRASKLTLNLYSLSTVAGYVHRYSLQTSIRLIVIVLCPGVALPVVAIRGNSVWEIFDLWVTNTFI
jgi:hypothetical protein